VRAAPSCRTVAPRVARAWPSELVSDCRTAERVLAREHRLTSSESFRQTVRSGSRAGSRTLVVHLVTPDEGVLQIGFVVSKAVGNAVVRNRVKRRLRHVTRERLSTLPGSCMLVVRALPAAADASYAELGADLDRCLRRAQS
jgi:ribonuclease P protein component